MRLTFLILCLALISGCTSTYRASGFLDDYYRLTPGTIFKQEYLAPDADFSKFQKVMLKPLSTQYLEKSYLFREEELEEMDRIFQQEFVKIYQGKLQFVHPKGRAHKDTLVVEPALTLLDTPNRMVNVLAPVSRGRTAFEVRLIDGGTRKILLEAAEKKTGALKGKTLVTGAYSKFGDASLAIREWVQKLSWLIGTHSG